MAIKYTNYFGPNYIGPMVGLKASLCTPASKPPTSLPLRVIWNNYLPAPSGTTLIGVAINAGNQQIVNPVDMIQSVTIDNLNVPYPVTFVTDDTNYEIICPANSIVTKPVITNSLKCHLFIQNIAAFPLSQGIVGTILYLNNFNMLPDGNVANLQFNQISNVPNAPPAYVGNVVGNQRIFLLMDLNTQQVNEADRFASAVVTNELFANVRTVYGSTGTLIITSVNVFCSELLWPPSGAAPNPQASRFGIQMIADGVASRGYFGWNLYGSSTRQVNYRIQDDTNLYVPLPLTSNYTFSVNVAPSTIYGIFVFDGRFTVIN